MPSRAYRSFSNMPRMPQHQTNHIPLCFPVQTQSYQTSHIMTESGRFWTIEILMWSTLWPKKVALDDSVQPNLESQVYLWTPVKLQREPTQIPVKFLLACRPHWPMCTDKSISLRLPVKELQHLGCHKIHREIGKQKLAGYKSASLYN